MSKKPDDQNKTLTENDILLMNSEELQETVNGADADAG